MGLDTKTGVGVHPGLVKIVTSMETSALPVPDGLEGVLQIRFLVGTREGVRY